MKKPLAAVLLTAAALAAPSSAEAGSYVLVGCADLAGVLGPRHVTRPADGWFLEQGALPSREDCAAGRTGVGIFAGGPLGPNLFRLDAPAHTTISRLVMTYRAHLPVAHESAVPTFVVDAAQAGGWAPLGLARGWTGTHPIDFRGDRVSADADGAGALRIGTRCEVSGLCIDGGLPAARFHALAVVLRDDRAPRVAIAVPGGHIHGELDLPVRVTDEGGGVFERTLSVDGRTLTDGALCTTITASLGSIRHVVRRVPCPLDPPTRVRVDTRPLVDGRHVLRARVEDVAGNVGTAEAGIVVDNRPPQAGTVALEGEPTVSQALTAVPEGFDGQEVAYAYRWQRCDAGGDGCREIGGAIDRIYALRLADAGHRVGVVVTAFDQGGSVRVASAPTGIVALPRTGPAAMAPAASAPRARLTAWFERGHRRLRRTTVTWPDRVRIRGRLTDRTGHPLSGATLRILERIDGRGWSANAEIRTLRNGRLTTFTTVGPSRHVRLVYGREAVTLRLRVRAGARFTVRRVGPLTVVSGRLLGGHVPRRGVRVHLQARSGASWSTRATLRTDGTGRFSAIGRAPAGVRLRIAIPAQHGYPFARGVARSS